MTQMMPQQQAPQQQAPQQQAQQKSSRRISRRSARFSNKNTRFRLEGLVDAISLSDADKLLFTDFCIPNIVDLEKKAARYRFWHNIFVIISGCAKVAILLLAGEAFSLIGIWALLNHIAILILGLLIGISDLIEYSFHLDQNAQRFERRTEKMEIEVWNFLRSPTSYENSKSQTEAIGKLQVKLVEIMSIRET